MLYHIVFIQFPGHIMETVSKDLMLFLYGNGSLITYLIFLGSLASDSVAQGAQGAPAPLAPGAIGCLGSGDFIPTIFQWFWPGGAQHFHNYIIYIYISYIMSLDRRSQLH